MKIKEVANFIDTFRGRETETIGGARVIIAGHCIVNPELVLTKIVSGHRSWKLTYQNRGIYEILIDVNENEDEFWNFAKDKIIVPFNKDDIINLIKKLEL